MAYVPGYIRLDRRNLAWQAEELKIALELMKRTGADCDSQSRTIIDIGEDKPQNVLHLSTINPQAKRFLLSNNRIGE